MLHTTKTDLLDDLNGLTQNADHLSFLPSFHCLTKKQLEAKIAIVTEFIQVQGNREILIEKLGLTHEGLMLITVFGPKNDDEVTILETGKRLNQLVDAF